MNKILSVVEGSETEVCGIKMVTVLVSNPTGQPYNATLTKSNYILRMRLQDLVKDQDTVNYIMDLAGDFARDEEAYNQID